MVMLLRCKGLAGAPRTVAMCLFWPPALTAVRGASLGRLRGSKACRSSRRLMKSSTAERHHAALLCAPSRSAGSSPSYAGNSTCERTDLWVQEAYGPASSAAA